MRIALPNGFFISIEQSKQDNTNFGVKFGPNNKPPKEALAWRDIDGRTVVKVQGRNKWSWRLLDPKKATEQEKTQAQKNYEKALVLYRNTQISPAPKIKAHVISEKMVTDLLNTLTEPALAKRNKLTQSILENNKKQLDQVESPTTTGVSWHSASVSSFRAIESFTKDNNLEVRGATWVGGKNLQVSSPEFITADVLLHVKDKNTNELKTIGVSLKKSELARLRNETISNEYTKDYLDWLDSKLRQSAKLPPKEDGQKRLKRAEAKSIYKKLDSNLKEEIRKKHTELKQQLLGLDTVEANSKRLRDNINKIFSSIDSGDLILVHGNQYVDSKKIKPLRIKEKVGQFKPTYDKKSGQYFLHYIIPGQKPLDLRIARIGIRQDGVGYGSTIKLEADISRDFFSKLNELTP